MSKLMKISSRSKTMRAPNWVVDAINGAALIGHGSYAKVYGCKDGSALKITSDAATISLASRLALSPLPGFAPVWRASPLKNSRKPCMAVSMPKLSRMNPWQLAAVLRAYHESLVATCRLHGFRGHLLESARRFAQQYACSSSLPRSSFSACLCIQLASRCRPNPQGEQLRRALTELASFCEAECFDIDLMGFDNWMVDDQGALVLTDPVVRKAYRF